MLAGVAVDHYIYVYYTFKRHGVCEQNTANVPVKIGWCTPTGFETVRGHNTNSFLTASSTDATGNAMVLPRRVLVRWAMA